MALEICIRLTHWMYGGTEPRMLDLDAPLEGPPHRLPIQWVVEMMEQPDNGITENKTKDIRYQVRLIVQQFFKRAKTFHYPPDVDKSMYTNVYLSRFLSSAAKILTMTRADLDGDTGDHWHSICPEIIECIQSGGSDATSDYAFQAALMFCEAILTHSVSKVVVAESQSLRDFIQIICKHEASVGQRPHEVVDYDRVRRWFMEKVQDPMLGIDTGVDPSILAGLAGGRSNSGLGHFSIQIGTETSSIISDSSQAAEIPDNTRVATS
ncbi:hypothetical protein H1R20_g2460, partial [Candolleomyces eurysporus]